MKRTFTLLVALSLMTMSIVAQKPLHNSRIETVGSLLKNKKESAVQSKKFNHLSENMIVKKHQAKLKSAQTIKQRLDSIESRSWDESAGQLVIDYKEKLTYDTKGNLTQLIDYEKDETSGLLLLSYKEIFSYDANGNFTQILDYLWDKTTSQWVPSWKDVYSYDNNGNMTQSFEYSWDETTSQWVIGSKGDYSFDASGNQTQSLNYYWDETTSQWVPSWKYVSSYDTEGNMTQDINSYWDETTSHWVPSGKYVYSYDTEGNMTQDISSNWDETTSQWVPGWKDVASYDTEGNMTQDISSNWDETTSQWVPDSKDVYTYDNTYSVNDLIPPSYFLGSFSHMVTGSIGYQWNNITSDWALDNNLSLYFSEQNITSTNKLNKEISRVYPNPFSESVSFSIPGSNSGITFELFDIQGRKQLTKVIGSNENVNMKGVRSGMYLYKLNIDGKIQSGKLVKE